MRHDEYPLLIRATYGFFRAIFSSKFSLAPPPTLCKILGISTTPRVFMTTPPITSQLPAKLVAMRFSGPSFREMERSSHLFSTSR